MKLFIGNINFKTTENSLQQLLQQYGNVLSLKIILDRETGRSKGFAFVEMSTDEEAAFVLKNLNGAEFDGKVLKIDYAKEKVDIKRKNY